MDNEDYTKHMNDKNKRRLKRIKGRNPVASAHGKSGTSAGPMMSKKDKKDRGKIREEDYDNS